MPRSKVSIPEICTKSSCFGGRHGCLTECVIKLAKVYKWRTAHFRPARIERDGKVEWRTAVSGDGAGFPDVVLVREILLIRELKSSTGKLSFEQEKWIDSFAKAKVNVGVWTSDDWLSGLIDFELKTIYGEE